MQHVPATIEEQLLLKAIKEECAWESLPKRLQATLSSKEEWHRRLETAASNLDFMLYCLAIVFYVCMTVRQNHV